MFIPLGGAPGTPLVRFPLLPVREEAFRVMTDPDFRPLVECMPRPSIAALVTVMGET